MMIASELSARKKLLSLKELLQIKKHYFNLRLPTNINKIFRKNELKKIVYFMKKDKKNVNMKTNLILLRKIGKIADPKKTSFDSSEIKKFLYSFYV